MEMENMDGFVGINSVKKCNIDYCPGMQYYKSRIQVNSLVMGVDHTLLNMLGN